MVTTSKAGSKGSRRAVITDRDGSRTIVNTDTGKVTKEFDSSGRRVIRLDARTRTPREQIIRGGGSSGTVFSRVDDQQEREVARRVAENRIIEASNARLLREGNISLVGGGVGVASGPVIINPNLMSSDSNISLASGGTGRVDISFQEQERNRLGDIKVGVNQKPLRETRVGRLTQEFFSGTKEFVPLEERKNLSPLARTGAFLLGPSDPNPQYNARSPFELISPAKLLRIPKAVKGVATATKIARRTRTARKVDQFVIGGLKNVGVGVGITQGAKEIGFLTTPQDIRRDLRSQGLSVREAERQLFSAGREAQKTSADQSGKVFGLPGERTLSTSRIFTEINPLLGGRSARESFFTGATAKGVELGLTREQSERLARRGRGFRGGGEALGIFSVNVGSEFLGTSFIAGSRLFQTGTRSLAPKIIRPKLFRTSAFEIGKAGVVEGIGDVAVTSVGRNERLTGRNLALGAGFGGLTAGVLGGSIVAQQAGRKGLSRGLYGLGAFLDPFEAPSDITATGLRRLGSQKNVRLPTIAKRTTKQGNELFSIPRPRISTFTPSFTPSPFNVNIPSLNVGGRVRNPASIFSGTLASTSTPSQTFSFTGVFGTPSVVPSFGVNTRTSTTTQTSVSTPANVFTGAVVSVPRAQLPPPIVPFGFPQGSGGRGGGKRGSKFINELGLGLSFLRNNDPFATPTRKKSKRGKR